MISLENKDEFLKNIDTTEIFLKTDYLNEKVFYDYNTKIKNNKNYTILHSLMFWINKNIKYSNDEQFRAENKFRRSAKEIWESGLATGCTDYALVFATLARQLNVPTTILHTMTKQFVIDAQNGNVSHYSGHAFCECFINNKWVLVDPTKCRYIENYDENEIVLSYEINREKIFIPCERNISLKKQNINLFNKKMDELCKNLNIINL